MQDKTFISEKELVCVNPMATHLWPSEAADHAKTIIDTLIFSASAAMLAADQHTRGLGHKKRWQKNYGEHVRVYHTKVLLDKGIIDKGIIRTKVLLDKGIVRN